MKAATPYLEAMRYVNNARKILSEHAGKQGKYYSDRKYVRLASHTAYTGALLALKVFLGIKTDIKKRDNVKAFKTELARRYPKLLPIFISMYDTLHLAGGYDGNLNVEVIQSGLADAETLIRFTEPITNK